VGRVFGFFKDSLADVKRVLDMNKIGERWTKEEIAKLVKLMELKRPVSDIADELGRCEKGVKTKYRRVMKGR